MVIPATGAKAGAVTAQVFRIDGDNGGRPCWSTTIALL